MSPGAGEEIGKVATSIVESLKNSPATLALIAFFVVFLILFYMSGKETRASMERVQIAMIAQQTELIKQLANCASGGQPTAQRFRLQSDESVPIELPRPRPAEAPP
jgi:hypothetical protein